jgi:hypothetical protein
MKTFFVIQPPSVVVTNEALGKSSANSERFSFLLKIAIGRMKFPMSFVQAMIVKFPLFTDFLSEQLCFPSWPNFFSVYY